ncbi:MAG: alanine racemase, partial [Acetatifactor sp.]|nr:alanine racemase [Acetatifactor sp.]
MSAMHFNPGVTMNNIDMNNLKYSKEILPEVISADASRSRAWIEVSLDALRHNVEYLQSLLPDHCALMPVVKANAYGHGAGLIAGELNALGIHSFCVACVSEGVELRRQNIAGEILVLGYTHPDQFPLLDQYALTQTVADHAHALALSAYACSASRCGLLSAQTPEKIPPSHADGQGSLPFCPDTGKGFPPLPVHIAVDTGMHRLGEPAEHTAQIQEMFALPGLQVTGMYSHLAAAGGTDAASRNFTQEQIDTFFRLAAQLHNRSDGPTHMRLHLQASYGILRYPLPDVDCARPGIALYGLLSNAADTQMFAGKLRPVLSLRARVASIH